MAILTGVFNPGCFPFFICFLMAGTTKAGAHIIRIAVSGVWGCDQIVRSVHLPVNKVTGDAIDTFIASIQPWTRLFSRYRLWDMASRTFLLGVIIRGLNISLTCPGDGVPTFLPRLINSLVTFGATLGIGPLYKFFFPDEFQSCLWNPLKLFVDEKIANGNSGYSEIAYSN